MLLRTTLFFLALLCLAAQLPAQSRPPLFTVPVEIDSNRTLTYDELIRGYEQLAAAYPAFFRLHTGGPTDIGLPLHAGIFSADGDFEPCWNRRPEKRVLMIMNGIHPGEPEGIDASLMLLRDLLADPDKIQAYKNLVIVVIPVYNVDGCLNRNSHSRANQNGPESYGFRGNARNFDLNRDFIKSDTRNARSFAELYQAWKPDVFIDNHTSDGADYQHTITLIPTQHDKLEAPLGDYLQKTMLPALYRDMAGKGWDMAPYVDTRGETPESGIVGFMDYPRYSIGYTALFHTIGFTTETHMLKPFRRRVYATYAFMEVVLQFMAAHNQQLALARASAQAHCLRRSTAHLDWQLDTAVSTPVLFKGYEAKHKPSALSGLPRLYYDRNAPWTREIPFFDHYVPADTLEIPAGYILPQAWAEVADLMRLNGVYLQPLANDTVVGADMYYIRKFETFNGWEGHYYHYNVELETRKGPMAFRKGDYWIPTDQAAKRYIVETLEPQAPDSWFAWNYFESVLSQKEYFSSYVFEDLAEDFLNTHPEIRAEMEEKKRNDPKFAASSREQLDWVYRRSPWYEPNHRRYPVGRVPRP